MRTKVKSTKSHERNVIFFEPSELDDALIGIAVFDNLSVTAYDYDTIVAIHKSMGMSNKQAEEWIEKRTAGESTGDGTPVIIWRPSRN
tara:strand:- start:607 stop:870 length:264 start_codon:yes stop_codon:yes gene_type:complete